MTAPSDAIVFLLRRADEHVAKARAIEAVPYDGSDDWCDAQTYARRHREMACELRECVDVLRTPRAADLGPEQEVT